MPSRAEVPLYHGDDFQRMADLRRAVDVAERKVKAARAEAEIVGAAARAGDDGLNVTEAQQALDRAEVEFTEFVDAATERAEVWVLEPIGHEEFRQLLKDHPPRKVTETRDDGKEVEVTDPADIFPGPFGAFEVNSETYPKALLLFVDPDDEEVRTVREPFVDIQTLRRRVKRLSAGEFDSLWMRAHFLNDGAVADPKASPYYGIRRSTET